LNLDDLDQRADREIIDDTSSVTSSMLTSEGRLEASDIDVVPYDFN